MRTFKALVVLALIVVAAGGYLLGRTTVGEPAAGQPTPDRGYAAGHADGVREGRAEEATLNLPAGDKAIYDAGYVAGAGDAFGGFDGGWDVDTPYVIVLHPGAQITYRIASRVQLSPGVNYSLCPDGHSVCQRR
jgi:hypothetical protein